MSYPTNPYDPMGSQPDVPALPPGPTEGEYPGGEYPPYAGQPGFDAQPGYGPYPGYGPPTYPGKSKVAAGILALFLGSFGIHNFYLGYTSKALIQLLGTLFSCGILVIPIAIWSIIEGILILAARPGELPWGVDADGVPLSA